MINKVRVCLFPEKIVGAAVFLGWIEVFEKPCLHMRMMKESSYPDTLELLTQLLALAYLDGFSYQDSTFTKAATIQSNANSSVTTGVRLIPLSTSCFQARLLKDTNGSWRPGPTVFRQKLE